MLVTSPGRYCLVDPCADTYIGSDPGGPFSMYGGVAVVDGLCDLMPRSLWIIVESSEGDKLGTETRSPRLVP